MTTNFKQAICKVSLCLVSIIFISASIKADETDTLFLSGEALNLELRSDFTAIRADTAKDPKSHDGKLILRSAGRKAKKFSVRVRARGDFRRDPEICSFPPLMVNFKKKEVKHTIFQGQDKLKLVTPCQKEEDVVEEYLIYKMYNRVTDLSMRVRLVRILYVDTGTGEEIFERYSFFIEDEDQVANRNNLTECDSIILTPFDLDRENFMKMALFEYLIGNKDWFVTSKRNLVIMQAKDDPKKFYAVPYDFDFAGLIDASYTKPRNVPEKYLSSRRVYKGLCYTREEFEKCFAFYKSLRPDLESIINGQELISRSTRRENIRYLEIFFSTIEDQKLIKKEFLDVCETRKLYNLPELP